MEPADDQDVPGHERHLRRLRAWRNPKRRDLTLGNLPAHVARHVEKPHKQVAKLVGVWERLLPPTLVERTALAGFARGVLTVHVPDSATLYELDRLLRGGLETQIKRASPATLRKVRLQVRKPASEPDRVDPGRRERSSG